MSVFSSVQKGYYCKLITLVVCMMGFIISLFGGGVECSSSNIEFLRGYEKPLNCKKYECPSYFVLHSEPRYEIRVYKKAKWMAFPVNDSNTFKDASTRGFSQLFDYIKGNNVEGTNITITAPILVDIGSSTTDDTYSPYIVNFYIPRKYQSNPPLPVFDTFRPVILPPKQFAAVRRFGGFSDDKNIPRQASALRRYLRGTPWEAAAEVELYSQAGYNPPYERTNRVNEIVIWFDL